FNLGSFSEFRELRQSNQTLEAKKVSLTAESRQLNRDLENWKKLYQESVDEVNSILERKAFSWVNFFSRMEEVLPARSYLAALAPSGSAPNQEFRVKVALSSREELGELIKNLLLKDFSEIKVLNESVQDNRYQVEMIFKDAKTK
ncbi:MAG: hypothetical protein ACPLRA_07360, partial [Candidatus Saccharicenans sp.]